MALDWPWRLAERYIHANLASSAENAEDIAEPVTRNIKELLKLGFNRHLHAGGIILLRHTH